MGKQKKAAFYCHGFHTSCSETEYLIQMQNVSVTIEYEHGRTEVFHEKHCQKEASLCVWKIQSKRRSGRGRFTLEASTISGNLDIFREFMAICEEHGVRCSA